MINARLVRYLNKLSKTEWQEFPNTISNDTLKKIFKNLESYHPDYKNLNEEDFAKKIKDKKNNSLNVKQLQNNFSRLANELEAFFANTECATQLYLRELTTIAAFAKRGLYEDFTDATNKLIFVLESKPDKGSHEFYLLYKLYKDLHYHSFTNKFQEEAIALDKSQAYLNKFHLLEILKFTVERIHRHRVFNIKNANFNPIPEVPASYEEPVFYLYKNLITLLQQKVPDPLMDVMKSYLEHHITCLDEEDKRDITILLIYCANYFYEHGHFEYLHYSFSLYKIADEHDFIKQDNTIAYHEFINITAIAAGAEALDWALDFINKYN